MLHLRCDSCKATVVCSLGEPLQLGQGLLMHLGSGLGARLWDNNVSCIRIEVQSRGCWVHDLLMLHSLPSQRFSLECPRELPWKPNRRRSSPGTACKQPACSPALRTLRAPPPLCASYLVHARMVDEERILRL